MSGVESPTQIGPAGAKVAVTNGRTVTVTGTFTAVTHAGLLLYATLVRVYVVVAVGDTFTVKGEAATLSGQAIPAPVPLTIQGPVPVNENVRVAFPPLQMVVLLAPPISMVPPG